MISPLPSNQGFGFTSDVQLSVEQAKGYRYEQIGRYHNYYFTPQKWEWPVSLIDNSTPRPVVDGFSPNLNKKLHIGHLRNLAVGSSVVQISNALPVAMLGAGLGEIPKAMDELHLWYSLANYNPTVYIDTQLIPENYDYADFADGVGEQLGCKVTHGENPVIVRKSNGQSTYALHDLLFAARAKPTHYITDEGQKSHFTSLGFGDKFLPMGLVLGEDGKKMKSRTGDAFSADDALCLIKKSLGTGGSDKLAWNVLAWNFLCSGRSQNVKFIPALWANPDRGGLYISYTYARVCSALKKAGVNELTGLLTMPTDVDIPLLGMTVYADYYIARARKEMDASPVANYAFALAKMMGSELGKQRVIGGTDGFQTGISRANNVLGHCMRLLTMHRLDEV